VSGHFCSHFGGLFSGSERFWVDFELIAHSDDSYMNAKGAAELGWNSVHLVERELDLPAVPASQYQVRHLEELRNVFPQFFKESEKAS